MKKKKILRRITAFAFAIFSTFTLFMQPYVVAKADETETKTVVNFDNTKIMDDLTDTQIAQFSTYTDGVPRVVSFMEYCYSPDEDFAKNYGLYAYVFNPSEKDLHEVDCFLSLCLTYDLDGTPQNYEKAPLTVLDKTNDNVLYKFKIETAKTQFYENAVKCATQFNGERRYDISTLTLVDVFGGNQTANIDKFYCFTGQASNTGNVEDNTLVCQAYDKLNLEPQFANYRTGIDGDSSNFDGYTCDEINTAYFSVPKEYFNDYGVLEKITAEWDEYRTTPIFVTSDKYFNDVYRNYQGREIADEDGNSYGTLDTYPWRVLWEEEQKYGQQDDDWVYFDKHYNGLIEGNRNLGSPPNYWLRTNDSLSRFDWYFYNEDADNHESYHVSKKRVEEFAETYSLEMNFYGEIDYVNAIKGAKQYYNQYLFEESIDADRIQYLTDKTATRGHMRRTIDAKDQDTQDLLKLRDKKSWWDTLWKGVSYTENNFNPIEVFTDDVVDFVKEYPNFDVFNTKNYLTNRGDSPSAVYDFCVNALKNDEYPVLFRFAVTDYYVSNARFDKAGNGSFFHSGMSDVDGYVAQETVFLGFDILSLSFRLNEKETLIPVVMDPVDVFNGLDANPNENIGNNDTDLFLDLLKQIFMFTLLGFAVIFFFSVLDPVLPLIKALLKGIVTVILFPFKWIGKLCKRKKRK